MIMIEEKSIITGQKWKIFKLTNCLNKSFSIALTSFHLDKILRIK